MLDLCITPALLPTLRGRLDRTENGHDAAARHAFSPTALVGFHASLPRMLAVSDARLVLRPEGEAPCLSLRLAFCGCAGASEDYAALLEADRVAPRGPLFFYRIELCTVFGRVFALPSPDGTLTFALQNETSAAAADLPLILSFDDDPLPPSADAVLYEAPAEAFPADEKRASAAFAALRRMGIGSVFLCPPSVSAADTEGDLVVEDRAEAVLPPGVARAAVGQGISLLVDFLMASCAREGGHMVQPCGRASFLPAPCIPSATVRENPAAEGPWYTEAEGHSSVPCCAYFCGEKGILSRYTAAGAAGFFLRAADCFDDAFFAALRACLNSCTENAVLIGAVGQDGGRCVSRGLRKRLLFGGELDSLRSRTLRRALLDCLCRADTAPLFRYLTGTLAETPPRALRLTAHALSDYEEGAFYDAVRERSDPAADEETLWEKTEAAYLIAATLPGVPGWSFAEMGCRFFDAAEEGKEPSPLRGRADGTEEERGRAFFARLARLRAREAVYRGGAFRLCHLGPGCLIFAREREGEALLTVVNLRAQPLRISGREGFTVVFGGRGYKTEFLLRPQGGCVLKVGRWPGEECHLHFAAATT